MANYQRSKIRIYPQSGTINQDELRSKLLRLKEENNIYETIFVYHDPDWKFVEIRFTAKRHPAMLTEIFDTQAYDIWLINGGEGGRSDYLYFYTKNKTLFWGFQEKVLYSFDEIRLFGEQEIILERLSDILGFGIKNVNNYPSEEGIKIPLKGLYTANNFFYGVDKGGVEIQAISDAPSGVLNNEIGEFWYMLFHEDAIQFMESFYTKTHSISGKNEFPFLKRITFYNKKRLTNSLEWTNNGGMKYWKHSTDDGFHNCANPRFFAYELLMK